MYNILDCCACLRGLDRAEAFAMAFYRFAAGGREPGDHGIAI